MLAGVQRLEEEEKNRQEALVDDVNMENADARKAPGMSSQQTRALSILRRLAFGMNRCVAKSNGEMAYQLLYEQEQFVTYRGYNMFFRYVPFAIMRCLEEAMQAALLEAPHLRAAPMDVVEAADDGPVAIDEIAEVMETEGDTTRVQQIAVQFNQKDDYLHRGNSVLLKCMSLVMYSRFVRRVPRSKAGKIDGVKVFAFDTHYPHYASSVQDVEWIRNLMSQTFSALCCIKTCIAHETHKTLLEWILAVIIMISFNPVVSSLVVRKCEQPTTMWSCLLTCTYLKKRRRRSTQLTCSDCAFHLQLVPVTAANRTSASPATSSRRRRRKVSSVDASSHNGSTGKPRCCRAAKMHKNACWLD